MLLLVAAMGWAAPEPYEQLPGRWYPSVYRSPDPAGLSAAQLAEVAKLEALGYLGGSEADGPEAGTVVWDRTRAFAGASLYSSGHAAQALLVAMDGRVLHTWTLPFDRAFPNLHVDDPRATGAWRRVALRPADGHLLAVYEGLGLVHLDASSQIVWATANRAHHEARWLPNGEVLVLTRILHPGSGPGGRPLLEDFVAILDADGNERRRVSVLDALTHSPWASLLDRAPNDSGDLLHTNAVFPLDPARPGPDGERGGNRVLLSMRHLDALAVLDLDDARLTWATTGPWSRQHDAEIVGSGALMLFDNRGGPDGASRVLALAVPSLEPVWTYGGPPGRPLRSEVLGSVQELPNGNVLLTESTRGRALEVTRGGQTVWEYHNPRVTGPNDAYVAAIFEMVRIPGDTALPWLRP